MRPIDDVQTRLQHVVAESSRKIPSSQIPPRVYCATLALARLAKLIQSGVEDPDKYSKVYSLIKPAMEWYDQRLDLAKKMSDEARVVR